MSDVFVNVNLYSALSHSASNALNAPNTDETSEASIGDQSWRCWVLDHADCCQVRSRRFDQSRTMHDGCTYRAVFLARRVDGGWPNEGAVVRRLGQPVYTARTGSPGHDCEDAYAWWLSFVYIRLSCISLHCIQGRTNWPCLTRKTGPVSNGVRCPDNPRGHLPPRTFGLSDVCPPLPYP